MTDPSPPSGETITVTKVSDSPDGGPILALYVTVNGETTVYYPDVQGKVAQQAARIRELEAQVQDGLDSWPAFGITNGQRQWRLQATAALRESKEAKP